MSMKSRSVKDIIESHLQNRKKGDIDRDIQENISPEIIILSNHGVFRGHQGVRHSSKILNQELPDAKFDYKKISIEEDYGFLEWSASSKNHKVEDGADSFVVRNEKIVFQSIHYQVKIK